MEGSKAGGGGGGGGGEVRKVHIVYFLSHDGGKIEQPHLLRVHHLHRNGGVHLRDVKRWLSDVRGEDMPDSYAWSYKRRYKSGYVWQDLKDDDLITPFSDNEYVLKGSEIASKNDSSPPPETSAVEEEEAVQVLTPRKPPRRSLRLEVKTPSSPPPPPPDRESPGGAPCPPPPPSVSDTSDEPLERAAAADVKVDLWEQIQDQHKKLMEKKTNAKKLRASSARHHRSDSGGGGSWWSGRRRTSSLLRNLLSCGAVETTNSTLPVQWHKNKKDVHIDSKNTAIFSASTNSRKSSKKMGNKEVSGVRKPARDTNRLKCGTQHSGPRNCICARNQSCSGFGGRSERNGFDKRQL